jgi:hypothetical protein
MGGFGGHTVLGLKGWTRNLLGTISGLYHGSCTGQQDVVYGLLEAMSSDCQLKLDVKLRKTNSLAQLGLEE